MLARRHRSLLNLLEIDWPQGIVCLQRARDHFGDGLVDHASGQPVVLAEVEQALLVYSEHMGGDDRQRMEACLDTFLSGLARRVAGLRVEANTDAWEPWSRRSLPDFQHYHGIEHLQATRDDACDAESLSAALGARFLPSTLRQALRWWSDADGRSNPRSR